MLTAMTAEPDDPVEDMLYCNSIMLALDKFIAKQGAPMLTHEDGALKSPEELLRTVHGGTFLHHGARRTWLLLNEIYPGHRVPLRTIAEFIESCAVCQKHKQGLRDTIHFHPGTQALFPPPHRRCRHGGHHPTQ